MSTIEAIKRRVDTEMKSASSEMKRTLKEICNYLIIEEKDKIVVDKLFDQLIVCVHRDLQSNNVGIHRAQIQLLAEDVRTQILSCKSAFLNIGYDQNQIETAFDKMLQCIESNFDSLISIFDQIMVSRRWSF